MRINAMWIGQCKEYIFSAIVSKIISDGIDYVKIMKREKKQAGVNFYTEIYGVLVNTVDKTIYNKSYDNEKRNKISEDILYYLLEGKYDYKNAIKEGIRKNGVNNVDIDVFSDIFIREISSNNILCKEIVIYTESLDIKMSKEIIKLISEVREMLRDKDIAEEKYKYKKKRNRVNEYINKWNENLFLNNYNERDENKEVNIKLNQIYTDLNLPHYKWKENKEINCDIKKLLYEYLCEHEKNKMLLIVGQPGIGKSSLITWMVNKYNENNIFVFDFASDLSNVNWDKKEYLVSNIMKELALSYDDLNETTIILDGFDEIGLKSDRLQMLNHIYQKIVNENNISRFSLIITIRENYIENISNVNCDYIVLQPFNDLQIKEFCNLYGKITGKKVSSCVIDNIINRKEIFGIPLILYMTVALNISVSKENSIIDVYDKIFSVEEGGIYDRCIQSKYFGDRHRISEIKEEIHQISRNIAMWMFENEPDRAYISKEQYNKICSENIKNTKYDRNDVAVGNYFKNIRHVEGIDGEYISFIHRSIYEYFVAETISTMIEANMLELTKENQEIIAGNIAYYLKKGIITPVIENFLQYRLEKFAKEKYSTRIKEFYSWWEELFFNMLNNGMFYYAKKDINYKEIIIKEVTCFANMLYIMRVIFVIYKNIRPICDTDVKYIFQDKDKFSLMCYICYYSAVSYNYYIGNLNLSCFSLKEVILNDITANDWIFSNAELVRAVFNNVKLFGADFKNADMTEMDLSHSNSIGIDIKDAIIKDTLFNIKEVDWLKERYDLKGCRLANCDYECISFNDYENGNKDKLHPYRFIDR
jgi:DNA polymerase III delta prime subunit